MEKRTLSLQRVPIRAFTHGSRGIDPRPAIGRRVQDELRTMMAGRKMPDGREPMRPGMWAALEYVPNFTLGLTLQSLNAPGVLDHVKQHPAAALYGLISSSSNYSRFTWLAPQLEPAIASDGEILAYYLTWMKSAPIPDLNPASLRGALFSHPIHGCRWATANTDQRYATEMLEWAQANATTHASAAWATIVAFARNPEEFRPVLQLDPLYLCALAVSHELTVETDALPESISGRWLYLLLRNNACEDPSEVEALLAKTDPFWATEWHLVAHVGEKSPHIPTILKTMKSMLATGNPFVVALVNTWNAIASSLGVKVEGDADDAEGDDDEEARNAESDDSESPIAGQASTNGGGQDEEDTSHGMHSARG